MVDTEKSLEAFKGEWKKGHKNGTITFAEDKLYPPLNVSLR